MTPTILPLNQKIRTASVTGSVVSSRQRTLEELYVRRATLVNLIHSLEIYDRAAKLAADKVVTLCR